MGFNSAFKVLIYLVRHEPFLKLVGCMLQPSENVYPRHAEQLTSIFAAFVRVLKEPSSNIGWDAGYAVFLFYSVFPSYANIMLQIQPRPSHPTPVPFIFSKLFAAVRVGLSSHFWSVSGKFCGMSCICLMVFT